MHSGDTELMRRGDILIHELKDDEYDEIIEIVEKIDAISPYIRCNLSFYKKNNKPTFAFYYQKESTYTSFISEYYGTAQIWTCSETDYEELRRFILKMGYKAIYGTEDMFEKLSINCVRDISYVARVDSLKKPDDVSQEYSIIKELGLSDYEYVAKMILSESQLTMITDVQSLVKEMIDRKHTGYGRNFALRYGDEIVSHVFTYSESNGIAVIGGVFTNPEWRGRGLATYLVYQLCKDLIDEGKTPYLFWYDEKVSQIYEKIGFVNIGRWDRGIITSDFFTR